MDFWSSLRLLLRWWPIVVLGVVGTVGVGAAAFHVVSPTYVANSQQVLTAPPPVRAPPAESDKAKTPKATVTPAPNPLLEFGGAYNIVAELLAKIMNGTQHAQAVLDAGGTGEYLVDIVPGDAPVISISVKDTSANGALATEQIVRKQLAAELVRQQVLSKADQSVYITLRPIFLPDKATYKATSRIRAAGALGVLGLGATVFAAFLAESIARRRRPTPLEVAAPAPIAAVPDEPLPVAVRQPEAPAAVRPVEPVPVAVRQADVIAVAPPPAQPSWRTRANLDVSEPSLPQPKEMSTRSQRDTARARGRSASSGS